MSRLTTAISQYKKFRFLTCFVVLLSTFVNSNSYADLVTLGNGTATYSQQAEDSFGPYSPDEAVNGIGGLSPPSGDGWAVAEFISPGITVASSQAAVWETASNVNASGIRFDLDMINLLGQFRFSYTTDVRTTFADGLDIGGQVDANWVPLLNGIVSGPAGVDYTPLNNGTGNIIATTSAIPDFPVGASFSVLYETPLANVTGVRLDAVEDASLPQNGPGLTPTNGNFLLIELTATAVPESSSFLILGAAMGWFAFGRKRKN